MTERNDRFLARAALVILSTGALLRLLNAVFHLGLIYPDEHFQSLEPANWVVNGVGWKSSEWEIGSRSWVIPGLYLPLLAALKAIGVTSGPAPIQLCRAMTALVSGAAIWGFWRFLRGSGLHPLAALLGLALWSLHPAMVVWDSATFSETWARAALWIAMPVVLGAWSGESRARWMASGICLGLPFVARPPMAAWIAGALLALLLSRRGAWRLLPWIAAGLALPVAALGALDRLTWGNVFNSLIELYRVNVVQGIAEAHGTSPWYDYLPQAWRNLGAFTCLLALGLPLLALARRRLRVGAADALVLVPALFVLGAHSALAHKELRFVSPVLPAVFYLAALGASPLLAAAPRFERALFESFRKPAFAALCLAGLALGSWAFTLNDSHFSPDDLSEFSEAIRADGALARAPGACLLVLHHQFLWTRGEMYLGHKVNFVETTMDAVTPEQLAGCPYAILARGAEPYFLQKAGPAWKRMRKNRWGSVLVKRE